MYLFELMMILVLIFTALVIFYVVTYHKGKSYSLLEMREMPQGTDELMVLREETSQELEYYRGGCTCWNSYPDGKRCTTGMEMMLSDFERYALNRREIKDPKFSGTWKDTELAKIWQQLEAQNES